MKTYLIQTLLPYLSAIPTTSKIYAENLHLSLNPSNAPYGVCKIHMHQEDQVLQSPFVAAYFPLHKKWTSTVPDPIFRVFRNNDTACKVLGFFKASLSSGRQRP